MSVPGHSWTSSTSTLCNTRLMISSASLLTWNFWSSVHRKQRRGCRGRTPGRSWSEALAEQQGQVKGCPRGSWSLLGAWTVKQVHDTALTVDAIPTLCTSDRGENELVHLGSMHSVVSYPIFFVFYVTFLLNFCRNGSRRCSS